MTRNRSWRYAALAGASLFLTLAGWLGSAQGRSHQSAVAVCDPAAQHHTAAQHLACLRAARAASGSAQQVSGSEDRDTVQLTDTPGNWFRSDTSGTPLSVIPAGGRVDFVAGQLTNTRHTATLIIKPVGSTLSVDQDDSRSGGVASATFDVPGVYVFVCKVHPYMTGVVGVTDAQGNIPPVTAAQLPFIGHLGVKSLPAATVLGVLATVAPTDADKQQKWDISSAADEFRPAIPGVGEVWIDTQFESVANQTDDRGVEKPGTITVVDAATFTPEREVTGLDTDARFRWNNPHNMWADTPLRTIYNGHWFGRWHNKIKRSTGDVLTTIEVGQAPTHTVSNPVHHNLSTLPLSADQIFRTIDDPGGNALQRIVDSDPTGVGKNHPHAQWTTSDGSLTVFPNVFKGLGVAGSIGVVRTSDNRVVREFTAPEITMPVATGIQGVTQGNKAYVANIVSGQVTVVDLNTMRVLKHIPVTLTPDCQSGPNFNLFDTLQVPIQTPVSPDGRFVATAVLSLTTVARPCTGSSDHVAVIDTKTDQVVKFVGIPERAGTANGAHGANFGMKAGGGWYAHIASQFSNMFAVLDLDPNGDHSAADAAVVGRIFLANGSPGGPRVTDGVGGQGIKPIPTPYDGWIQGTVAARSEADAEVQGWIDALTPCQRNPSGAGC